MPDRRGVILDLRIPRMPARSTQNFHRLGRHCLEGGRGVVLMPCMAEVVRPKTLASLQCRDRALRVFTDQAGIAQDRGGGKGRGILDRRDVLDLMHGRSRMTEGGVIGEVEAVGMVRRMLYHDVIWGTGRLVGWGRPPAAAHKLRTAGGTRRISPRRVRATAIDHIDPSGRHRMKQAGTKTASIAACHKVEARRRRRLFVLPYSRRPQKAQ